MGCLGICNLGGWAVTSKCFFLDMFCNRCDGDRLGAAKTLGLVDNWQTPAKTQNLIVFMQVVFNASRSTFCIDS